MVPSGRLKVKLTWSPGFGLVAPRSTETAAGEPEGPVTVAPVSVEETEFSLRPNGEPATSSDTCTDVGVGDEITSRPSPLVPRSACCRSAITCFSPAWVPVPFMMESAEATAGVLIALPEKI